MSKHSKLAFGLFEDGHTIRLVQLLREKGQILLQGIDRVELDQALYHTQELPAAQQEYEKSSWEDTSGSSDKLKLDELDEEFTSELKLSPWDAMLASVDLKGGIIALNCNDDYLIRVAEPLSNSRAIKRYAKTYLTPEEYKLGDWQSSSVKIGNSSQIWLHRGVNLLLEMIQDYKKKNRLQLFYQLADSNDLALTDYFRINHLISEQRTMLIHLGQEYRKAFIFEDGKWTNTLILQITQREPEPDVIYSKLSLALDNANERDPERIVLCGELAHSELAEYLHAQYSNSTIEMLSFSDLAVPSDKAGVYDAYYLSQYAIPIALACKALNQDDPRWTPSNFLPPRIMEGQKVFKIAWHGFIVLFLIFAVTFWATVAILKTSQEYRQEKIKKRDLEFTLEQRRKEAAEIQKIRNDLENQEKNIEILKQVLDKKNPWTETLAILNRALSSKPTSWLASLKLEKDRLYFNGATTYRANIIGISEALPNSQIRKVVYNKIRDANTWNFEITAELPVVDWSEEINKDLEELRALKSSYGEAQEEQAREETRTALSPLKLIAPSSGSNVVQKDKKGRAILPPLPQESCPAPREELLKGEGEDVMAYRNFVIASNKVNAWDYRDIGVKFLNSFPKSELAPAVRWWLCYRLYLDKDYSLSKKYLEPMLKADDRYLPYALLLQARVMYAWGQSNYKDFYAQIKSDYGRHSLMKQVNSDLEMIGKGDKK
jgi:Tfp pilus assembly protein PilN